MRLVIGGAYQGKRQYVVETYGVSASEMADGAVLEFTENTPRERCVYNFQLFIKQQLEDGIDFSKIAAWTEQLYRTNPDIIMIMDEVGSGIIPMEKSEREWRETVGRIGCLLAEHAESVERIVCGRAVRIK